jgi:hypothetical protein
MAHKFSTSYIEDSLSLFRHYKKLAERAIEQVSDHQLFTALDDEMNSIAIIVKHMAGNMRSRWTDFLTSDGEKPDRNRDSEFVAPPATREDLMRLWNDGWERIFEALQPLSDADLEREIFIRGRAAFGDAGHQSPDRTLFLSLRADRVLGEALQGRRVEVADGPSK